MGTIKILNLKKPDETRPFASKGKAEIFHLENGTVGRATFEPGWKWSECLKPIAGTDTCEVAHLGICMSGRMRVRMNDGTEAEFGPGDVLQIDPGHDAWVVGKETCVVLDFAGMEHYAERRAGRAQGTGAAPSQPGMH